MRFHPKAKPRAYTGLAVLFGCLLWAAGAQAGSLQVGPLRLTLSAAQPVSALTVRNEGTQPMVIHVQGCVWSQEEGDDIYLPSQELLATPPIFTVPPGGAQIVRVGLRRPADPQRELAYRLYVQEVLPSPEPGFQGLQTALRIGVPIFVAPAHAASPVLRARATHKPQGTIQITLSNAGNAHIQIASFSLSTLGNTRALVSQPVSTYLLPDQTRHWLIKTDSHLPIGTRLLLSAQTDVGGEVHAEMVLEEP
jgi:fimbrial chaperone protein